LTGSTTGAVSQTHLIPEKEIVLAEVDVLIVVDVAGAATGHGGLANNVWMIDSGKTPAQLAQEVRRKVKNAPGEGDKSFGLYPSSPGAFYCLRKACVDGKLSCILCAD
jgi:hypothetical protein